MQARVINTEAIKQLVVRSAPVKKQYTVVLYGENQNTLMDSLASPLSNSEEFTSHQNKEFQFKFYRSNAPTFAEQAISADIVLLCPSFVGDSADDLTEVLAVKNKLPPTTPCFVAADPLRDTREFKQMTIIPTALVDDYTCPPFQLNESKRTAYTEQLYHALSVEYLKFHVAQSARLGKTSTEPQKLFYSRTNADAPRKTIHLTKDDNTNKNNTGCCSLG